MDPTATLYALLAAYAANDADAFNDAADALREWHDKGGFLPSQLQSMHDDLAFDAATLPRVETGRRDDDADDDADTLDFRIFIRPDGSIDLQTGDPCYDTDHRGDIGCGTVSKHDDAADIRAALLDALAEAIDSAATTFALTGSFHD